MSVNNKIPKIKDPNDPEDVGVKARIDLFKTMKEVNEDRVKNGKEPIISVNRIFNNYYKPKTQPAGSDAPVSMGRGSAPVNEGEYTYNQIHKTSFLDFFRKK